MKEEYESKLQRFGTDFQVEALILALQDLECYAFCSLTLTYVQNLHSIELMQFSIKKNLKER